MSLAAPPMRAPSAQGSVSSSPLPSTASGGPTGGSPAGTQLPNVRRKPSPSVAPSAAFTQFQSHFHPPQSTLPSRRPPLSNSAAYNYPSAEFAPTPASSRNATMSSMGSYTTTGSHTDYSHAHSQSQSHYPTQDGNRRGGVFHRKFNASTDNVSMSSRLSISSTVSSASVLIRKGANSLGAGMTRGRNKISRASKHSIMGISNIFHKDKKEPEHPSGLARPATTPAPAPKPAPASHSAPPTSAGRVQPPPLHSPPSNDSASRAPGSGTAVSRMTVESDAAAATRQGLTPAAYYVRQMQQAEQAKAQQRQPSDHQGDSTTTSTTSHNSGREAMIEREKERLKAQRAEKSGWRTRVFGDSSTPATPSEEKNGSTSTYGPGASANQLSGASVQRNCSVRSSKETSDALLQHAADLRADAAPSAAAARDAEVKRTSQEVDERNASSFYEVDPTSSVSPASPPLDFSHQTGLGSVEVLSPTDSQPSATTPSSPSASPGLANGPVGYPPPHPPFGSLGSVVSLGSMGTDSSLAQETDSLRQWADGIERSRASAARAPVPRSILKKRDTPPTSISTSVHSTSVATAPSTTTTQPPKASNNFPFTLGPTPPPPGAASSPAPTAPTPPQVEGGIPAGRTRRLVFAPRAQLHSTWPAHI